MTSPVVNDRIAGYYNQNVTGYHPHLLPVGRSR